MTFEQAAIILLLVTMLVVFAVDRWRMEVVALAGLGAGVMFGLVPITDAEIRYFNNYHQRVMTLATTALERVLA